MIWTASSWRAHKDQTKKHWQCLTQYPAHGRELTIFQFFKNILISFIVLPSFPFYFSLRFIGTLPHYSCATIWGGFFQIGILRLRERSGFPKVAQWSVKEPGLGPPVAREETDAPIHCTLTWCLRLIYWDAALTDTPGDGWGALQIPILQDIASRTWRDLSIADTFPLPAFCFRKAW